MSKALSKASPGHVQGKGGVKGGKAYCILGFRVPTTSVGAGGKTYCILGLRVPTTCVGTKGNKAYCILGFRVPTTSLGTKGSKAYCILGFRVPTTSVGERGEGEQRRAKEMKGAKGGEGEQSVFYTRF